MSIFNRKPDLTVRLQDGTDYLYRWHLLPRNRWFNIYLHKTVVDDYRVLHDHPWSNVSIILKGGYYEDTAYDRTLTEDIHQVARITRWCKPGKITFRRAEWAHRLSLPSDPKTRRTERRKQPSWSLFLTGPVKRNWGFWTRDGWKPHEELIRIKDGVSQMTAEGLKYLL